MQWFSKIVLMIGDWPLGTISVVVMYLLLVYIGVKLIPLFTWRIHNDEYLDKR